MNTDIPARSLEVRISQLITNDGSAIISPRIARWLEDTCKLTADRRIRLRDNDPDAYVTLTALHLAALRSENGTKETAEQRNTKQSQKWLSTKEAAKALDVTDRCIRKWCTTGQLNAELTGARWLVDPNSIALKDIASRRTA